MNFVSKHDVEYGQIKKQQASGCLGFTTYMCATKIIRIPLVISVVSTLHKELVLFVLPTHTHTPTQLLGSQSSFIPQTSLKWGHRFGSNVIHNEAKV